MRTIQEEQTEDLVRWLLTGQYPVNFFDTPDWTDGIYSDLAAVHEMEGIEAFESVQCEVFNRIITNELKRRNATN